LIGVSAPPRPHQSQRDENDGQDGIDVMQGALGAAYELIWTYDPCGQPIIDGADDPNPEDAHNGLVSDDLEDDEEDPNSATGLPTIGTISKDRAVPSIQVKHVHASPRPFLDGYIKKYHQRVEDALKKDQLHTTEAYLQQLMEYT
jgi:hypothetical protein